MEYLNLAYLILITLVVGLAVSFFVFAFSGKSDSEVKKGSRPVYGFCRSCGEATCGNLSPVCMCGSIRPKLN